MEEHPFDCIKLSPGLESTSSTASSKMQEQESVPKSNKYGGSAYVKARYYRFLKARKQRQEMKAAQIEYDDPPLDHLLLLGPSMSMESDASVSTESDSSASMSMSMSISTESDSIASMSMESESSSIQSKLVQEATLVIKMRHSGGEEVVPFDCKSSPPLPLQSNLSTTSSPWPQSNWKLEKTYEKPSISVRESIVNSIKAESTGVTPASNTRTTRNESSDSANTRRYRHVDQVKAMARSRKERNGKTRKQVNDPAEPFKSKASNSFNDFVDHLLTVNATNQLCRSPEPTQTLPPVYCGPKKKVSWKGGDPNLPKPVLRRRSNSPTRPNLPKPVLKRAQQNFTQRFSSRPVIPSTNAPYDEAFVSSPGGWKSMFTCGAPRKVLDSP